MRSQRSTYYGKATVSTIETIICMDHFSPYTPAAVVVVVVFFFISFIFYLCSQSHQNILVIYNNEINAIILTSVFIRIESAHLLLLMINRSAQAISYCPACLCATITQYRLYICIDHIHFSFLICIE